MSKLRDFSLPSSTKCRKRVCSQQQSISFTPMLICFSLIIICCTFTDFTFIIWWKRVKTGRRMSTILLGPPVFYIYQLLHVRWHNLYYDRHQEMPISMLCLKQVSLTCSNMCSKHTCCISSKNIFTFICFSVILKNKSLMTVQSSLQETQPGENLLNACGPVMSGWRSVARQGVTSRRRWCWCNDPIPMLVVLSLWKVIYHLHLCLCCGTKNSFQPHS